MINEQGLPISAFVPGMVRNLNMDNCALCFEWFIDDINQCLQCAHCKTRVHKECYGQTPQFQEAHGIFMCQRCQFAHKTNIQPSEIECAFCPHRFGILKRFHYQNCGGKIWWAHVVCATMIPQLRTQETLEAAGHFPSMQIRIPNIKDFEQRAEAKCYICQDQKGFAIPCNFVRCKVPCNQSFHYTCGIKEGLVFYTKALRTLFPSKATSYSIFCSEHLTLKLKTARRPQVGDQYLRISLGQLFDRFASTSDTEIFQRKPTPTKKLQANKIPSLSYNKKLKNSASKSVQPNHHIASKAKISKESSGVTKVQDRSQMNTRNIYRDRQSVSSISEDLEERKSRSKPKLPVYPVKQQPASKRAAKLSRNKKTIAEESCKAQEERALGEQVPKNSSSSSAMTQCKRLKQEYVDPNYTFGQVNLSFYSPCPSRLLESQVYIPHSDIERKESSKVSAYRGLSKKLKQECNVVYFKQVSRKYNINDRKLDLSEMTPIPTYPFQGKTLEHNITAESLLEAWSED